MANPDAVLDSIDGALRDYATSRDAMRWTPDAESVAPEKVSEPVWFELGQIVNMEAFTEFGRQISAMFSAMTASLGQMSVPLMKMAATVAHARDAQERPRWHRRRCPRCNPRGFASTACPEMHDYRRRLKARARRKRRRG